VSGFINWRGHSWLALAARLYLGWIFVYACLHKIAHPHAFGLDIATYDMLPLSIINLTAITLPWVELFAGIMLIVGFRVRGAALAVAGMMVMFTLAIILALAKGLDMSCGCFASQTTKEDPISYLTVLRDLGWLALAMYVAVFDRKALGVDWLLQRRKSDA
jgi:uncharacterized membrane protein YphA (DoxX/SURF4 family)